MGSAYTLSSAKAISPEDELLPAVELELALTSVPFSQLKWSGLKQLSPH